MSEIYVSVDVEADGPIPGPHSMLSIGAAAFLATGEMIATFTCNLDLLPDAAPHPETAKFWRGNHDAFLATRIDPAAPAEAMTMFVEWVEGLKGGQRSRPVFVGYPAGFDWTFTYWYMIRFVGRSPFGFQALDMKSYAMAKLGTPFRETVKRTMPREWFSEPKHTHVALEDAIEQGELFIRMLKA